MFSHLISLIHAVKIVFQFRIRCTLPTCAVGHHERDFWPRYLAVRFRLACTVYGVWTALRKFMLKIELVLSIFFYLL